MSCNKCQCDPCCCKAPAPDPCADLPVSDLWEVSNATDYIRGLRVYSSVDSCGRTTRRCRAIMVDHDTIRGAIGPDPMVPIPVSSSSEGLVATLDGSLGSNRTITLTGDVALTPTNLTPGQQVWLNVVQDAVGGWSLTGLIGAPVIDPTALHVTTILAYSVDGMNLSAIASLQNSLGA